MNTKSEGEGEKQIPTRGPLSLPKNRGTGFERESANTLVLPSVLTLFAVYYADPPMTPQEAQTEQELYSPYVS